MEFIEKIPILNFKFIRSMSFDNYLKYCNKFKSKADAKTQYGILMRYCDIGIKGNGECKKLYAYSDKNVGGGRLFSSNSIQTIPKQFRGFFMSHTKDIDQVNSHPKILEYVCKKHDFECIHLTAYNSDRDKYLIEIPDGKDAFLKAINTDKINRIIKNPFFNAFDKEVKLIQKYITELPEYENYKITQEIKQYNWLGSSLNRILCKYENEILQRAISVINKNNIEIGALMFDGLMTYTRDTDSDTYENLLLEIENDVEEHFSGLNMKWKYKQHDNAIVIPDDWREIDKDIYNEKPEDNDKSYENIKLIFEETHSKIIEQGLYTTTLQDDTITLHQPSKFNESYRHLKYYDFVFDDKTHKWLIKDYSFIKRWFNDENIKTFINIGTYPPPLICPNNILNLWQPFAISKQNDLIITDEDEKAIDIFIKHCMILCNNQDNVCDYFIKWMAQMFQYPAVKTIAITLISKEGAGKGTLLKLIENMMGYSKLMETTHPSRDCWGSFNSMMQNCFLCNLNEMSLKETADAEGRIKGLITDNALNINKKGIDTYAIKSYHRFFITTNNDNPIKSKKDDRRNVVIISSDELIGDMKYFEDTRELFARVETQKVIYDYLMAIPNLNNFGSIIRPITEFQEDMQELSRNVFDEWLEFFTYEFRNTDEVIEYSCNDCYTMFKNWAKKSGNDKYETNTIKMSIALKRLNISGFSKIKKNCGNRYNTFDIIKLRKYFNIEKSSCALDLADDDI